MSFPFLLSSKSPFRLMGLASVHLRVFGLSGFFFLPIVCISRGSSGFVSPWGSLLALLSSIIASFFQVRLLRLEFRVPYTLLVLPPFRCSSIACSVCWFASFLLHFLSILPFFGSSRFCLPAFSCPFVFLFPNGVSFHAVLLFLLHFRLVRCSLLLRLPSLRFVCLVRILLIGFLI